MEKRSPWAWIPTLYFAEALPYVAVMTISVIMYKKLGVSNTDIALYTGWLYLPWVIKPFWSPFVDLFKTKRWWAVTMQLLIAIGFAAIAFCIPTSFFFQMTLAVFWIVAFTSATHDIAADGFYMHALSEHDQSLYVGIRSTFYRIATVSGQGLLVIIAGLIEINTGLEPVQIEVKASPAFKNELFLPDVSLSSEACSGDMHFVTSSSVLEAGVSPSENDSVAKTKIDKIIREIGFQDIEKKNKDSESQESCFTTWVRETFGEKREPSSERVGNIAVVGLCLSKAPDTGQTIILNMAFKKGDPSISLEEKKAPTRFEFTKDNWNKPVYVVFNIDKKLKSETSAVFEGTTGNISLAWSIVFAVLSLFFLLVSIYHKVFLPKPDTDIPIKDVSAGNMTQEFFATFNSFFKKKQIWVALLFILLYRLPEAQLVKLINPFLLDPIDKGGMGLTTGQVGIVYGTIGIIGLTIGGIIGGVLASRDGLKHWLWPMVLAITLPDLVYVFLSYVQPDSFVTINLCVFVEQFGYGFGFTAYMLYLIYFSEGKHKTAHYAICTGFMALGMMLPGMMAGWLQETIGYRHFFIWTMICCIATIAVTAFIKIDPEFGKKKKEDTAS